MEIEKNNNDIISVSNSLNNSSYKDNTLLELANFNSQKRKRRSKNDQEGRLFKCDCGRAYLSALALSNHKKSKHVNDLIETTSNNDEMFKSDDNGRKKRGRPKKNSDFKIGNYYEMQYNLFFESELRRKVHKDNVNINNFIKTVFNDILVNNKEKCNNRSLKNPEEYPILNLLLNKYFVTHTTCDQIFVRYLEELSKLTNDNYFLFVFKFILLFRECINKYKNIELENSILILNEKVPKDVKEFTQFYDAEQIPELCNEFLSDFLESNDFFGIKDDFIPEFIPIIQHFCFWLYHNNFTSSRLSLSKIHE